MIKRLSVLIGVILGLITLMGIGYNKYTALAKVEYVAMIEEDVEDLRTSWRADKVQQRIWNLEDRYTEKEMPQSVKEEYRQLKKELDDIYRKRQ